MEQREAGGAMLDAGGGGGAMYAVQIESLEVFQQKLTTILQSLEQDNTVMRMSDGTGIFGSFPEAQTFSSGYEQTKQDLINSFNEVTQLVNTMISVVGANADKYKQTEQDITSKFNSILQQYGDAPTTTTSTTGTGTGTGAGTGTGSSTSGTTYYPQGSGTTYATHPSTTTGGNTTTTTTTTTGSGTTSTSAGAA
jgi:hypothetical protein